MPQLPPEYAFLTKGPKPDLLSCVLGFYGLTEVRGPQDNPIIMAWAKKLGVASIYVHDEMAWCALFVGACMAAVGLAPPKGVAVLRALEYAQWGSAAGRPSLGDVLVFKRDGGGHVGLYVGEDAQSYRVLGGNQGDRVSIVPISKDRLFAVRREPGRKETRPVIFKSGSGPLSTNEA